MAAQSQKKQLTLAQVNEMDFQDFTEAFGSVIERTPLVAATVWSHRPYESLTALHRAFSDLIQADLPLKARVGIIRCYPDLAGKLAESDQLSEESTREHKAAGLLGISETEKRKMTSLNERYKEKFCFPFVVCARENKVESIITGLESRLKNALEDEQRGALEEISKIAWHRLKDIVADDQTNSQFALNL